MFSYVAFRWCIVAKILIKVPSFKETSSALKDFCLHACYFIDLGESANYGDDKLRLQTTESDVHVIANINREIIYNSKSEKLLGVTYDCKVLLMSISFKSVIKQVKHLPSWSAFPLFETRSKKANNESIHKCATWLLSSLISSRHFNNRKKWIQETVLRIVYDDKLSSFTNFFDKNIASIYGRNLQVIATEIYKTMRQHFPNIIQLKF